MAKFESWDYRDGSAVDLSVDHKPEDTTEKERIEKAGGCVSEDGRVNGGLYLTNYLFCKKIFFTNS